MRGATSAASAMSAIVVASKPRSANRRMAASTIGSRVRCFLRSRSPAGIVSIVATVPTCKYQQAQVCSGCKIARTVLRCGPMAHLLGTLRRRGGAGHWKRSLAIVVVVLVALGVARRRRRRLVRRRLQDAGHRVAAARSTCSTSASRRRRATRRTSSSRSSRARCASASGAPAIERDGRGDRRQPHVTGAPTRSRADSGQVSADGRIAFVAGAVRRHRLGARQGAGRAARGGVRDRRARRPRGLAQRGDRRPGRAGDRARRRADRHRGRRSSCSRSSSARRRRWR